MTEVSKMTDAALNRALAERLEPSMESWNEGWFPGCEIIPDYCNDPAASLEVQAAAMDKNEIGYMAHLTYRTGHDYHVGLTHETAASMLRATPRQRAEAAYMVLKGD